MDKALPKGWAGVKMGELYYFIGGGTPSKSNSGYWNGDIPWASIKDISKNEKLKETQDFISVEGLENSSANVAEIGEVIMGTRMLPGKAVVTSIKTAINQDLKIVRPKAKVPTMFTYYQFRFLRNVFEQLSFGTTVKGVTIEKLQDVDLLLPPLLEQERIVAKLNKLFAQHEKIKKALDRIPQLLKTFRQQVLTRAVTGKLTEVLVLENKLVSDFFDVKTGATPKKGVSKYYDNGTIPWIKSGEVKNAFIYSIQGFITETAVKETNAKVFPKDTILVAMYGEGKTRGQVGWMKVEAATNQAIAALVNEDLNEWTRRYIYLFCVSQYNEIRSKAEGGNQPNLNLSKIKNWEISIPQEVAEQQRIVQQVESLFAKADAIEARYQKLKEKVGILPQAILHKAFKGELVPQLPTDGDAKDLLAEIMALKNEVKRKKK